MLVPKESEAGCRQFWVTLCVELTEPMHIDDAEVRADLGSDLITGYYQSFGITARSEEDALRECFAAASRGSTAGVMCQAECSARVIDATQLDASMRGEEGSWEEAGIWYRSGRAFFGPEDVQ